MPVASSQAAFSKSRFLTLSSTSKTQDWTISNDTFLAHYSYINTNRLVLQQKNKNTYGLLKLLNNQASEVMTTWLLKFTLTSVVPRGEPTMSLHLLLSRTSRYRTVRGVVSDFHISISKDKQNSRAFNKSKLDSSLRLWRLIPCLWIRRCWVACLHLSWDKVLYPFFPYHSKAVLLTPYVEIPTSICQPYQPYLGSSWLIARCKYGVMGIISSMTRFFDATNILFQIKFY